IKLMTPLKNFLTLSLLIGSTSTLTGCATTYHRGDGVIIAEKKIKDKDYKPHHATQTGALIGGSTVQSDNERKPLTITQYTTRIPLNTPVHILEKDNLLFI